MRPLSSPVRKHFHPKIKKHLPPKKLLDFLSRADSQLPYRRPFFAVQDPFLRISLDKKMGLNVDGILILAEFLDLTEDRIGNFLKKKKKNRLAYHLGNEEPDRVPGDLIRWVEEGRGRQYLFQPVSDGVHASGVFRTYKERFTTQLL